MGSVRSVLFSLSFWDGVRFLFGGGGVNQMCSVRAPQGPKKRFLRADFRDNGWGADFIHPALLGVGGV